MQYSNTVPHFFHEHKIASHLYYELYLNETVKKKKITSNLLTWTLVSHVKVWLWNANMVFESPIKPIFSIVCVCMNSLQGLLNPLHHKQED